MISHARARAHPTAGIHAIGATKLPLRPRRATPICTAIPDTRINEGTSVVITITISHRLRSTAAAAAAEVHSCIRVESSSRCESSRAERAHDAHH